MTPCLAGAYWWDTRSSTVCELPLGHDGDHCDGDRWFVVANAGGMTRFAFQRPTDTELTRTRSLVERQAGMAIFSAWRGGATYGVLAEQHGTTQHNIRRIIERRLAVASVVLIAFGVLFAMFSLATPRASAGTQQACYMVARPGWLTYFKGAPVTRCFPSASEMHDAETAAALIPIAHATMPGAAVEFVVRDQTPCIDQYGGFDGFSIDNLPDGVINVRPLPDQGCDVAYTYWRLHYKYLSQSRPYRTVYADTPLSPDPSEIKSVLFNGDWCKVIVC